MEATRVAKWRQPGLPNGGNQGCQMAYFQTKNPELGWILLGLAIEAVGKLYVHSGMEMTALEGVHMY
jgi:hypothetical protein